MSDKDENRKPKLEGLKFCVVDAGIPLIPTHHPLQLKLGPLDPISITR